MFSEKCSPVFHVPGSPWKVRGISFYVLYTLIGFHKTHKVSNTIVSFDMSIFKLGLGY